MLKTGIQHQLRFFVTLYSNFICGWSPPLQSLSEHQTQGPSVDPKCCMHSGLGSNAISISWPLPSVVFVFVFPSLSSAEHWCLSVSLLSGLKRHTRWLMGKTNHASSRGKESTTHSLDWALKDLRHTWHILNAHTYVKAPRDHSWVVPITSLSKKWTTAADKSDSKCRGRSLM